MLRLILLLDFQKSMKISRQISRQKNKKPCDNGKKERLVVILKTWRKKMECILNSGIPFPIIAWIAPKGYW